MRILITGATGFVGKTLVPYLYGHGWHEIALLVRNESKVHELFGESPFVIINNTHKNWFKEVEGFNPDVTIHLATLFSGKNDFCTATEIVNTNILFTTQLLESLTHTGCSCFINIGTFSEFQHGAGIYKANNLYSASKTAIRPIIGFYQTISGFKWINVIVYSPYGRHNTNKKIIDYLIDAVGSNVPVAFSEGKQILDFIHVDDMASFFDTLLRKLPDLPNKFYEFHLGSGRGISIREAAATVEKVYGQKVYADWGKLPYRKNDIMHAVAPISSNISLLGWSSKISFEEGIRILKEDNVTVAEKNS